MVVSIEASEVVACQKKLVFEAFNVLPQLRDREKFPTRTAQFDFVKVFLGVDLGFPAFQKYAQACDLREPNKSAWSKARPLKDDVVDRLNAKCDKIIEEIKIAKGQTYLPAFYDPEIINKLRKVKVRFQ